MRKDEQKIAKEIIKLGKRSSKPIFISIGKTTAKLYRMKKVAFPGENKLTTPDGFEAYINLNQHQLIHEIKSDLLLKGISPEKSKNPYLKGSQQLILKMPLDANEEEKIKFLRKATKHFKDLIKDIIFKDGKVYEIMHRPKKGKKLNLLKDYQNRNRWIIKRINELRKDPNAPKQEVIFKQVAQELSQKFHFGNLSVEKPLSPSRIKNIYYSK